MERRGGTGVGTDFTRVLPTPQVHLAQRQPVGVDPELFRTCPDPGADPHVDEPGGRIQTGYRSGDADLLSADSGSVRGNIGNAGPAAGAGCRVPQSVNPVLGC